MDTETTGAEALAGGEAVAEVALVETPEATTGQEAETGEASTETGENTGDDAAAQPKKKHWAHERIDELTRNWREAERRAVKAEQRLQQSQNVRIDDLEYEDQIAERTIQRTRQETAENAREAALEAAEAVFFSKVDLARERYADFDAVAFNDRLPIPEGLADLIRESDLGPDILYHLGKNVQEASHLATLPPTRQARELGKLEARLSAPKAVPKPAPAPVNPVGGNASGGSADPSKMSMAEYVAARAAGKI